MIIVRAKVRLYKDERNTPFTSGYRPLFDFLNDGLVSGQIDLRDISSLAPGEEGEAIIRFVSVELIGHLEVGQIFAFSEGGKKLGTIIISEIISLDEN